MIRPRRAAGYVLSTKCRNNPVRLLRREKLVSKWHRRGRWVWRRETSRVSRKFFGQRFHGAELFLDFGAVGRALGGGDQFPASFGELCVDGLMVADRLRRVDLERFQKD